MSNNSRQTINTKANLFHLFISNATPDFPAYRHTQSKWEKTNRFGMNVFEKVVYAYKLDVSVHTHTHTPFGTKQIASICPPYARCVMNSCTSIHRIGRRFCDTLSFFTAIRNANSLIHCLCFTWTRKITYAVKHVVASTIDKWAPVDWVLISAFYEHAYCRWNGTRLSAFWLMRFTAVILGLYLYKAPK